MSRKRKPTVGILSLGCPRNLVDSEGLLGRLCAKGYRIVDMHRADMGIVNTCAFIEDAKKESIDAILDMIELKREGKLKKVIVYGCLSQRYKTALREELPEVDAFVGRVSLDHCLDSYRLTPKHFAYLKVCEGCINNCSYCAIPRIKGPFTSLTAGHVLERVRQLDGQGVREINIVGQDITSYGMDVSGSSELVALLKRISKAIRHIGWVRLLYLYPSRVDEALLDLIRDTPSICKYIDLPLQHINGRILRLMGRSTTPKQIRALIEKIRRKIPGVAIRTSLIVGFPSETEKEFGELARFIDEVRFERLGIFTYSREEGTPAASFRPQVPEKTKIERLDALMLAQQRVSQDVNRALLGKDLQVLIDEERKEFFFDGVHKSGKVYLGRTQFDAPEVDGVVYVDSKKELRPGDFATVKITDTLEYDLIGELRQ